MELGNPGYRGPLRQTANRLLGPCVPGPSNTCTIGARTDPALKHAGEYRIRAEHNRVEIHAADNAGIRHALATLAQIRTHSPGPSAAFRIEDRPSFPTRSLMLDISRCRVPTMDSLFELLDELERLKYNHLQLYTEHTFAYRAHDTVWSNASPMTHDEFRALDAHALERGIELCPNQNTLGHMHRWLAHEPYRHLAEITDPEHSWTFETDDGRPIERRGPFSLCATDERSIDFVRGLLEELLPCFSSPRVNIGLDEAIDLGQGRSADTVRERQRANVFVEYLTRIAGIAHALGKRPMFWSDMLHRDDAPLDQLPSDATALVWGYEADAPFNGRLAQLQQHGIDSWVCPGTSCWRTLTGRTSVRQQNLANAARAGAARGATGFLLTEWGDLGHRQHWPVSRNAIRAGAQAAWNADDPIAIPADPLSVWLDELGDLDIDLRKNIRNAGAIFTELERPMVEPEDSPPEPWRDALGRLDALRTSMPRSDTLTARELVNTLDLTEIGIRKAIARRQGESNDLRELADRMHRASDERRELWLARAREGGLDESLGYDRRIIEDLREHATP